MAKAQKGSQFEREVCKSLSMWWSDGDADDLFWRSSTSGARATTRKKAGRRTRGHYGDIAATCPEGEILVDCITFELKRGYAASTFQDLMDRNEVASVQVWEQWINQAVEAWGSSGSYAWALITRRDGRQPLICMPQYFYRDLKKQGLFEDEGQPGMVMRVPSRSNPNKPILIFLTTLKHFLKEVQPCHIRQLDI